MLYWLIDAVILILLGMGLVYLPFGILMWLWERKWGK